MDDFLSDIYTILFAKWILLQEVPDFETKVNEDYTEIHFYNKHADIEIVFNPLNIIEFKATNTQSGETEYYLHFQMKTLNHKSAVKRNRLRRRIYEIIRQELPTLKDSHDIVLMVFSAEVYSMSHEALVELIKQLFSQATLYK